MLNIEKLTVGQLKTNCYLLYDSKTMECIIVDPGDEADFIIRKISDLELKPQCIIATHCHFDHIQAVNELKLAYKIDFWANSKEESLLKWMRKSAIYFTKLDPGPAPNIDQYLSPTSLPASLGSDTEIIEVPGHTPGGISLYIKEEDIVFTGDTMFAKGGVGRTDFPYCNKKDLYNSIDKLLNLPDDTIIYPGHGESSLIKFEKEFH